MVNCITVLRKCALIMSANNIRSNRLSGFTIFMFPGYMIGSIIHSVYECSLLLCTQIISAALVTATPLKIFTCDVCIGFKQCIHIN